MSVYDEIMAGLQEIIDHKQGKTKLRTKILELRDDGTIVEIAQKSPEPSEKVITNEPKAGD